jgi:hypothetical protein
VIAVELQGHGRTADTDRPLSFETMGDDIAALLNQLSISKADIVGLSLRKKIEDLRILGGICARTRGGGLSKSPKVATFHTPLRNPLRNEHLT